MGAGACAIGRQASRDAAVGEPDRKRPSVLPLLFLPLRVLSGAAGGLLGIAVVLAVGVTIAVGIGFVVWTVAWLVSLAIPGCLPPFWDLDHC